MATFSKDFIVKNGLQVGGTTLRVGDIILKDMGDNTMNVYQSDGTTLAAVITPSSNVSYDNSTSGLTATNVKAALDELKTSITNQDQASEISYSNSTSGLTAATVQAAIDEIIADQDTNTKALLADLDGDIIPSADITYDLGSPTKQWRDLYIGPGSLYLNGTKVLEDDSGTLNFTADANQSMTLRTSGTGQTDITSVAGVNFSSTGTGSDISLTADGNIEINSNLLILAGKSINTSDGNAVTFSVDADFGANSITATTVTADLVGDVTGTVSSLSNHDTDDVAEGSTNQYYTDTRAQGAISTDSTLSYSSGVVSMPASGVTAGSYGAAAAVPVITVDAQGRITSASTTAVAGVSSVTYTASSGILQIDTSDGSSYTNDLGIGTSDSPTFAGLTVSGDLTVSGTTTTINTETVNIADNQIVLNSNFTGSSPTENGGIEIERGTQTNKTFIWDETDDKWTVGSETFVAGTVEADLTGNVTGDVTGNADTASAWATARTLSLTGAVTGSASVDGSGNVSLSTTATSDPTLTLAGDASGSATFTNLGNATLTVTVADDSHNHVTSNIDGLAEYISDTVGAMVSSNTESGISVTYDDTDNTLDFNVNDPTITLTGAVTGSATMTNLGNVSIATTATADPTLTINGDASGSATFTNLGNATLTLTVADDSHNHTTSNIDNFTESVQDIAGGMWTSNSESGVSVTYQDADGTLDINVNDPTITLTGAVTGSATMTNLGNVSIATTATADPTLTINGDASGSATFTNLGNATLTLTIADDSHNHTIANVDGLQTALNGKQAAGTYNTIIGTDSDINTSGSTIIDYITVTDGVITAMGTRTLSASDIGALGSTAKAADSNLLDGLNSTQFLRSDTTDVQTSGAIRFNDNIELYIGSGSDVEHYWNGSNYYTDINGGANWYLRDGNSSNATRFTFDIDNGTLTCTDVNVTSDERLKENVETISDASSKVTALRGVNFDWKESGAKTMGVIAQEVEEVIPEVVATDDEGMKSVNYQAMVGLLIEAVKDLQAQVDELKTNK